MPAISTLEERPDPSPASWKDWVGRRWSSAAAIRAVQAAVVLPGLFAFCYQVVGDRQMATFAAFGSFSTLVFAGFTGTRRDKLAAHLGLAVVGSVLVALGTVVSSLPVLATLVMLVVGFAVLFLGIVGPNVASGATAVLLAFVLPAASPGTISMVPSRLEGWWLASVAGTIAILLFSPKPAVDPLRVDVASLARALADELETVTAGVFDADKRDQSLAAQRKMLAAFTASPFRPTGLTTSDQALNNMVGILEWVSGLIGDAVRQYSRGVGIDQGDQELLREAAMTLRRISSLLAGDSGGFALDRLKELRQQRAHAVSDTATNTPEFFQIAHRAFHARMVALAVQAAGADALIVARRAGSEAIAKRRLRWIGNDTAVDAKAPPSRWDGFRIGAGVIGRHASLRSMWLHNSARGALALAAAVAIADLSGVQHGFWVVLAALSVLRANAASTGVTAVRAIAGTGIGFVIGAGIVAAVGTNPTALWLVLPVAVLVASYTPGVTSFVTGQAAFTVAVAVLYNLLVPVGWVVGLVRIEAVAMGCLVSLGVGLLLWPRGAAAVVGTDLYDAFTTGSNYLRQAASWALGTRPSPPDAGVEAVATAARLDDALRGYLNEQGAKQVIKNDLWRLVGAATRLRLTAASLAGMAPSPTKAVQGHILGENVTALANWYQNLASHLSRTTPSRIGTITLPALQMIEATALHTCDPRNLLDIDYHLRDLHAHQREIVEPAGRVATLQHRQWWR